MEAADWSATSAFTKFYHKSVCKRSSAKAALGQTEQRSLVVSSKGRRWSQHIKVKYRDDR